MMRKQPCSVCTALGFGADHSEWVHQNPNTTEGQMHTLLVATEQERIIWMRAAKQAYVFLAWPVSQADSEEGQSKVEAAEKEANALRIRQ